MQAHGSDVPHDMTKFFLIGQLIRLFQIGVLLVRLTGHDDVRDELQHELSQQVEDKVPGQDDDDDLGLGDLFDEGTGGAREDTPTSAQPTRIGQFDIKNYEKKSLTGKLAGAILSDHVKANKFSRCCDNCAIATLFCLT